MKPLRASTRTDASKRPAKACVINATSKVGDRRHGEATSTIVPLWETQFCTPGSDDDGAITVGERWRVIFTQPAGGTTVEPNLASPDAVVRMNSADGHVVQDNAFGSTASDDPVAPR